MYPKNYKIEAADSIERKIEIWNMILNEVKNDSTNDTAVKEYIIKKINALKKSLEMLQLI